VWRDVAPVTASEKPTKTRVEMNKALDIDVWDIPDFRISQLAPTWQRRPEP
jgi:hypothetical protein